jgi:hypothetical protein
VQGDDGALPTRLWKTCDKPPPPPDVQTRIDQGIVIIVGPRLGLSSANVR